MDPFAYPDTSSFNGVGAVSEVDTFSLVLTERDVVVLCHRILTEFDHFWPTRAATETSIHL